jgi:hypothetical protein
MLEQVVRLASLEVNEIDITNLLRFCNTSGRSKSRVQSNITAISSVESRKDVDDFRFLASLVDAVIVDRKSDTASMTLRTKASDRQLVSKPRNISLVTKALCLSDRISGVFLWIACLPMALSGSKQKIVGVTHRKPRIRCTEGLCEGLLSRQRSRSRRHMGIKSCSQRDICSAVWAVLIRLFGGGIRRDIQSKAVKPLCPSFVWSNWLSVSLSHCDIAQKSLSFKRKVYSEVRSTSR